MTIYLKRALISLWSFRLAKVLVITVSSLLERTQSRDSVSSAVSAWVRTVPRDLVTFAFLLDAEVNFDSRFSSSSNRESYRL